MLTHADRQVDARWVQGNAKLLLTNAEKAKVEKERNELREDFNILEEKLGTGTWQYDSEDGTQTLRLETTASTRVLRSVSSEKTGAGQKEHEIVDLDVEGNVAKRVDSLLAQQAGARVAPRLRLAKRLASHRGCLPGPTNLQALTWKVAVIHPRISSTL